MAIASMLLPMNECQNSLLIMRFWNENVKCVFVDCRQKISAGKSKQTSTFLEARNSNTEIEFRASAYLFKFDVKYKWNNSFLNCGCRRKWRMIIAVNFLI